MWQTVVKLNHGVSSTPVYRVCDVKYEVTDNRKNKYWAACIIYQGALYELNKNIEY